MRDVKPFTIGPRAANPVPWSVIGCWISALMLTLISLPAAAAPAAVDSEEAAQLLAQLEEQYEVLTLEESWVLRPTRDAADEDADAEKAETEEVEAEDADTEEATDFDVIEIRAGSVTVDGERMTRDELRELVGDAADLMHSLAELAGPATDLTPSREESEDEPPPPRRRRTETDTRISFASSLTVEEHESVRDVVVIGGSLEVLGEIDGDAVAVGGSVEVRGEVDGSVTAVGGSVSLGPDAIIDGDVSAIGGNVHREPGATIHGGITELSLGEWEAPEWDFDFGGRRSRDFGFVWVGFVESVIMTILLAVFVLFTVLIARGYVGSVADRATREPWKAGLVGLIAEVLFVPAVVLVFIILAVSVIGIPLAILWMIASPLCLILMFLIGFTSIALAAGRKLEGRFDLEDMGPYVAVLLGIALIQGWTIVGEAFSFVGGPIKVTAWLLILMGFLVKFVAWTVGLGAVLLHGFAPLPESGGAAALPASSPRPSYPPPPPPAAPPSPPFEPLEDPPEAEAEDEPEDEDAVYSEVGERTRPKKTDPDPPVEERPPEIEDGMYYSAGRKAKKKKD